MIWLVVEALVALGVMLFVVWWTMRGRRPEIPPARAADSGAPSTF